MKIITERELKPILRTLNGKRTVAGSHSATPRRLIYMLDTEVDGYNLFILNPRKGLPQREGVTLETSFIGPGMRGVPHKYYPCRLSLVPKLLTENLKADAVFIQARLEDGKLSMGGEVNILPTIIRNVHARGGLVIAQLNDFMPWTWGDSELPAEFVDYAIVHNIPLESVEANKASEIAKQIAYNVTSLIPEGATLQVGIGAVPDTVLLSLKNRSGLKVYSEMISDGVMELEEAGCFNKDTPIRSSFVLGSAKFYKWLDHNSRVKMIETVTSNDPGLISKIPKVVALNTALQIDLNGQANANYVKGRGYYSGIGGQTDFEVGALHSEGGVSILALASWHAKACKSTIIPQLQTPATSFLHSYVVTEYGVAQVSGVEENQQARNLIAVAHPSVREALAEIRFGEIS